MESSMERKQGPWTIRFTTEKHRDDFIGVTVDDVSRPPVGGPAPDG